MGLSDGMSMIFIYCTYPDIVSAKRAVDSLLSRRLVACANIIPGMLSIYRWQNKIEESNEVIVIFKTQVQLFETCKAAIKKDHPYQVPCILEIEIKQGDQAYLNWLREETDAAL